MITDETEPVPIQMNGERQGVPSMSLRNSIAQGPGLTQCRTGSQGVWHLMRLTYIGSGLVLALAVFSLYVSENVHLKVYPPSKVR